MGDRSGALPRVLVVDDFEDFTALLSDALSDAGCEVMVARSARKAWEIFRAHRVRAMITERAPGAPNPLRACAALELARRIKETAPDTVVIMVSTSPPGEAALVCDAVFRKPMDLARITAILDRLNATKP
ncbi:MAG: response regulator [Armatimonadetes bacterium]|nr:response regulator [Armatimonadota bacterium]